MKLDQECIRLQDVMQECEQCYHYKACLAQSHELRCRLGDKIYDDLNRISKETGITRSAIIEKALEQYLGAYDKNWGNMLSQMNTLKYVP